MAIGPYDLEGALSRDYLDDHDDWECGIPDHDWEWVAYWHDSTFEDKRSALLHQNRLPLDKAA